MADEHERSYSDREFSLILNRAAELSASAGERHSRQRTGLSLDEIKVIAIEAGFDPTSIDRAARQLAANSGWTAVDKAIGGPYRLELTDRVDVPLTEDRAAHLLALVRAAVEQHGVGDLNSGGMAWSSATGGGWMIVTAHREKDGTRIRIAANRQEALALTAMLGLTAGVIVPFMAAAVIGAESVIVNTAIFAGGLGGSLAAARAYWSSATARWRTRATDLMESLAGELERSSQESATGETGIEAGV